MWLLAVGLADAAFGLTERLRPRARYVISLGAAVVAVTAGGLGVAWEAQSIVATASWAAVTVVLWQVLRGTGEPRAQWRSAAALLVISVFAGVTVLALGWWSDPAGGLLARVLRRSPIPSLSQLAADRALLLLGIAVALIETANVAVRLTLDATQVTFPRSRLRGGRIIGPVERLLVFGFALAGEFTGAALIVSAKTLLRFPEVSGAAGSGSSTADDADLKTKQPSLAEITEYFLVGSLISWFLALVAATIARA